MAGLSAKYLFERRGMCMVISAKWLCGKRGRLSVKVLFNQTGGGVGEVFVRILVLLATFLFYRRLGVSAKFC